MSSPSLDTSPVEIFPLEIESATTFTKVVTTIQLVYGIPSFLLLIAFIFFLGCSKNYQNSFYRLVQLDLLTNILCYFNTWIALRLEKTNTGVRIQKSIESTVPGLLNWSNSITNFFMHMQFCSAIVLSLHRITSVKFYTVFEKLWCRFYPLYGLLCAIYSTSLMLFSGKSYLISVINGTLTATYYPTLDARSVKITAFCSVAYFSLLLGFGLFAAYLVAKTIRTLSSSDSGISKKLTKIAITYCAIYSGIMLWSVLTTLNAILPWQPDIIAENNFTILLFSSDMFTLALPYILLIYDANVRRDVVKLFRRQATRGTSQVFVSSTPFVQT